MRKRKTDRGAKLLADLAKAKREEEVLSAYARALAVEAWDRPFDCDGFWNNTLFEMKHDQALTGTGHHVLAQAVYYLRRFVQVSVYKGTAYPVPRRICLCDRNELILVDTDPLIPLLSDKQVEWQRAASAPDPLLVLKLRELLPALPVQRLHPETINSVLGRLADESVSRPQRLYCENIVPVFNLWRERLALPQQGQLLVNMFLHDVQNRTLVATEQGQLYFDLEHEKVRVTVPMGLYQDFWKRFERPPTPADTLSILSAKDTLVAMSLRRRTGEFFTPLHIAEAAASYLERFDPAIWDRQWWDPCCGTGNLTLNILGKIKGRLYLSTLEAGDVEFVRESQGKAGVEVFKYDFLNEKALPPVVDMKAGDRWCVFMNPPFAAGPTGITVTGTDKVKTGTSATKHADTMEDLGHAQQNLYSQFMHRVAEISVAHNLDCVLGVFSMQSIINTGGFEKMRAWLPAQGFVPVSGFCFSGGEFDGTSAAWPCIFTIWHRRRV